MCLCLLAIASASVAGPAVVMAPEILSLSPDRRDTVIALVASPVVVVLSAIVAASSLALSAVVVAIGLLTLLGSGCAPTAPGYLDRATVDAAPADATPADATPAVVVSPVVAIRFLPPIDDVSPVDAEIHRLQECETRALNSRHIARAASYRQRWIALIPTIA